MDIVTYFDPYNIEHLKAYKHLQEHGSWANGFIPENMDFPNGWSILVMNKLANAWLDHKVSL